MAEPKESFPDSDAWAAEIGTQFQSSSARKAAGKPEATTVVDKEFKTFVSLDLTNIGG